MDLTNEELRRSLNRIKGLNAHEASIPGGKGLVVYSDDDHRIMIIPYTASHLLHISIIGRTTFMELGKEVDDQVLSLLRRFIHTPLTKRMAEKQYLLKTGPDDYLMAIETEKGGYSFVTTRNSTAVVGEAQLQQLKEDYPDLALMFERIAERV